jgi:hypothetical protein
MALTIAVLLVALALASENVRRMVPFETVVALGLSSIFLFALFRLDRLG